MNSWPLSHVRSRDKIKAKCFLLNNACGHQLGRIVTYNEKNSPMMSHDPLTTRSHEVARQNKSNIPPLLQNPWPPNLAGRWLRIKKKLTRNARWHFDHVITWDHVTSSKLKISSYARSLTTQQDRLVTYGYKNLLMDSYDPLTQWWCVVTCQTKSVTYPLWQNL